MLNIADGFCLMIKSPCHTNHIPLYTVLWQFSISQIAKRQINATVILSSRVRVLTQILTKAISPKHLIHDQSKHLRYGTHFFLQYFHFIVWSFSITSRLSVCYALLQAKIHKIKKVRKKEKNQSRDPFNEKLHQPFTELVSVS